MGLRPRLDTDDTFKGKRKGAVEYMPEKKRKIPLLGREVDVTEVPITQRGDQVAEYALEDGSIIRFAAVPTSVFRLDDQWNADGSPVYLVVHGSIVTTVEWPPRLQKPSP